MLRLFCFASFRLYAFVEAAALRSIALRYAGGPVATRVFFLFLESFFPSIFCTISGHGDGDGAGAGTGTGVEVNEGAQDGNGDGSGDGAGMGTETGA